MAERKPHPSYVVGTDLDITDRAAIVTGASRGIGRAVALNFARHGANVALNATPGSIAELEGVADEITKMGRKVIVVAADITEEGAASKVVSTSAKEFGRLDILVNNAGIWKGDSTVMRLKPDNLRKILEVNLVAPTLLTGAALPHLMKQPTSVIEYVSSIVPFVGSTFQPGYGESKAGVLGLMTNVAREYGPRNVRALVIAPGAVLTDMLLEADTQFSGDKPEGERLIDDYIKKTPLGRTIDPEEIANVALFAASDMGLMITGTVLHVNGGLDIGI